MLFYHLDAICKGAFWLTLLVFVCAGYAYRVNARRPDDDPKKRVFHPAAIFLAPILWPLLLLGLISLSIIRALVYGLFLIVFTVALLAFRESFLLVWVDKLFTSIGNKLLDASTFLIRVAFGNWKQNPQPI